MHVGLGVGPQQLRHDIGGWILDHQQRLSLAYCIARQKMDNAASQSKQHYDKRAKATPLLPGERVWVRNRNRRGQGKLCTWWDPEQFVIVELVGNTGLVYRIKPEKGGRERTVHRNALKVCLAPPIDPNPPTNGPAAETHWPQGTAFYGFAPAPVVVPAQEQGPEVAPRRSNRTNLGQPPARYREI